MWDLKRTMMDAGFRRHDEFNTSPMGHNEAARDFKPKESLPSVLSVNIRAAILQQRELLADFLNEPKIDID